MSTDHAGTAEHAAASTWTKGSIHDHLHLKHGGLYVTSRDTKRTYIEWHASLHKREDDLAPLMEEASMTAEMMRVKYGCTGNARLFAEFRLDGLEQRITDHIADHEAGEKVW